MFNSNFLLFSLLRSCYLFPIKLRSTPIRSAPLHSKSQKNFLLRSAPTPKKVSCSAPLRSNTKKNVLLRSAPLRSAPTPKKMSCSAPLRSNTKKKIVLRSAPLQTQKLGPAPLRSGSGAERSGANLHHCSCLSFLSYFFICHLILSDSTFLLIPNHKQTKDLIWCADCTANIHSFKNW